MFDLYSYTDKEQREILKSIIILIDSREQENRHIIQWFDNKQINYQTFKLDSGDYSFKLPALPEYGINRELFFDNQLIIERKNSLEELSGNFTEGRARFENEFLRAGGCRKILMIESGSLDDIFKGRYKTHIDSKSFIGSLLAFKYRHGLDVQFISPENSARFIYLQSYYFLRQIINS